ncbi:acyltransferase [Streptomyces montanus]|uniref:Acyltransferase n=1 Tax=Streptomyces montanus TaxID=2580423 RepID=A0A5R9FR18_9ACTN|nr:acyltransferase [Streptomyces montanus]TLS46417.1 acyltransferase [Streptomyces montanus]
MTVPSRDALPSLTGLRFWAALLVVLYHLSRQVGEVPGLTPLVWYGRTGVTFFFVLSGFVLAWTYEGARLPVTVFYRRRFARIWPLHLVTTALSVALYLLLSAEVSVTAVAASLPLMQAWHPALAKGGNPAAWSLSDEAWFYALFPGLLALLAARGNRLLRRAGATAVLALPLAWLCGALVVSPAVRSWLLDYLPLTRSAQFVLGVVCALAVKRGGRPPLSLPAAAVAVLAWHTALIPWHAALPDSAWYGPYNASQLLSAPLFAALIAAAAHRDVQGLPTGLRGTWLLRLGRWSFAWYLVHELVLRLFLHLYGRTAPGWPSLVVWLVLALASQALAGLLYALVERPAESWLRSRGSVPRRAGRSGADRLSWNP